MTNQENYLDWLRDAYAMEKWALDNFPDVTQQFLLCSEAPGVEAKK